MYDTLHIRCKGDISDIIPLLMGVTEIKKGESRCIVGNLKNLRVNQSEYGISIKGSLSKWFLGNNIETLTRDNTKQAVESLSDTLHLSLKNAQLSRIDFAQNFSMDYKPELYYPYLGVSGRFIRNVWSTTLYYSKTNIVKLFYDKILQCKNCGIKIDESLNLKNLLRFEVRFDKQLPKIFNREFVNVEMLYEESFYKMVFDKWFDEYLNITKIPKLSFQKDVLLKPNDFVKQLTLKGIMDIGGQYEVFELIEEAKKRGQFERPEYASRTKIMVADFYKREYLIEPSELINELDNKFKNYKQIAL